MIKNFFLFFWALALFATLSKAQVSSVTGQYLQDNNLLLNPGFESGIGKWTNSAGTFTADYSVFVQGKASGKVVLSSQALNFFQDSTIFASQLADGMQAILTVKIKSSVAGVRVCPRQAGSVITSLCIDVQGNNKWGLYQIPFVTGATSQGISINSNSTSITGTVYVDESYVGVSNILNSSSEAKLAGEAYFAGTSGCVWSRTSTTLGAFGAVAACPGPTISYQSLGQWQTTDSNLPRITVNNLPAGVYKATFHVWVSMVTTQVPALSINDGTTSCYPIYSEQSSLAASSQVVSCTFTYTSSGNRIFELYGASNTSTINISNPSYTPAASGTKFQLEYYGSNSTYTTLNADTDWASCGHTTSSFTGFGTVSAIETQCKREGSDLLMRGKFTSGVSTPTEARLSLPVWNGAQITSAGTSQIPSIQLSGFAGFSANTATIAAATLIEPSVTYITFSYSSGTTAQLTKQQGSNLISNGQLLSFSSRIPIEGWQNSNIIIGAFNALEKCTDSYECTDVFSAKVAGNAGGTVSAENIDWINGNCSVSTGVITCPLKTGLAGNGVDLVNVMNCTANVMNPLAADRTVQFSNVSTSSSLVFQTVQNTALTNLDFSVVCQKQGVDYIGKTAKAVASDQNLRTIGIVNGEIFSFSYGTTNATTPCSASPCSYLDQIGSQITSVSRSGLGQYTVNFSKTYSKLKCNWSGSSTGMEALFSSGNIINCSNCSSANIITARRDNGNSIDSFASLICHGVP